MTGFVVSRLTAFDGVHIMRTVKRSGFKGRGFVKVGARFFEVLAGFGPPKEVLQKAPHSRGFLIVMGVMPIFCFWRIISSAKKIEWYCLLSIRTSAKTKLLDELIRPVVEGLGFECWGIEFVSQGKRSMLRVYIESADAKSAGAASVDEDVLSDDDDRPEKQGGVELADCEKVSRQLSGVLDVEDPIANDYTLEVSSPGLDRPLYTLEHFKRFVGSLVELRLRMAFEGRRKYKGILAGVEGNDVVIKVDQEEYLFPLEGIEKTNVVPQFD